MNLILNLGLKSVRAIVFEESGQKVTSVSQPINTLLKGTVVEQDPNEWWSKSLEVLRRALSEPRIRRSIRSLTVTSSSSCLVTLDKNGDPLGNAIMVSDTRATAQSLKVLENDQFRSLVKAGVVNDHFAHASFMIPKIMWIREEEPDRFQAARHFVSPNDFLILRLTGNLVTDSLNAEKFYYSGSTASYPEELLGGLGIPLRGLPAVRPIGSVVGDVKDETKRTLGFPSEQRVDVILSTYDAICAFVGSGAIHQGEGSVVSGTVSSLRAYSKAKPAASRNLFCQFEPGHEMYITGGSNNLGGGLIEWAKQCFYQDEKHPYEAMENEARESLIGAQGVTFLPYLLGERAPLWDQQARGVFFGLERFHTRKDFARAVFESACYSIRHIMEEVEEGGICIDNVRFSGGMARIPFIGRIMADILGKRVMVLEEFETTSLGAFMFSGVSTGLFRSLAEAAAIVKVRDVIMPDREASLKYDRLFGLYRMIYRALIPSFRAREEIVRDLYFEQIERIDNL